jgi:hypothetical protein
MATIHTALVRLNVAPQKIGFWEVTLERAAEQYCYDMDLEDRRASLGSRVSYKELIRFKDALRRDTSTAKLVERWNKLDASTQVFVSMHYRWQTGATLSFSDLDLSQNKDREALRCAMNGATKWLGNKPGYEYPIPLLNLVRTIISVYKTATDKKPGFSSETNSSGVNYTTPFEDLVAPITMLFVKWDVA